MKLLWLVFGLVSPLCFADVVAPAPAPDIITGASLLRLGLGLSFVLFLIFALAWVTKRYSNLSVSQSKMKVISTLPLGAREKAVLIAVGDKQMLLGVAPGRVNLIESFDQPVVTESSPESQSPQFATLLVDALSRRGKGQ